MKTLTLNMRRIPLSYVRLLCSMQSITQTQTNAKKYSTYAPTADPWDAFTLEPLQRNRTRIKVNTFDASNLSARYFMDSEAKTKDKDILEMTVAELDNKVLELLSKNKEKQVMEFISGCDKANKKISDITLKKLFRIYSIAGKPDIVEALQKYCLKVVPYLYKRNGDFMHYMAKAQCMKGNSEKGLSILTECYQKNTGLRSFYRIIFRELIQDSVLYRSEASLVTFKKYVLQFSENWSEHYPLVCFWHICWSSSWFSDQMLSNELLESSVNLQNIVRDKAPEFSMSILKQEYNEDAVVRLLQILLKYEMMIEYVKVLQVLFSYKLKNRDLRGCTEIIKNCEALGVSLSSSQQGRYIRMLIEGKKPESRPPKPALDNFKLKF